MSNPVFIKVQLMLTDKTKEEYEWINPAYIQSMRYYKGGSLLYMGSIEVAVVERPEQIQAKVDTVQKRSYLFDEETEKREDE